MTDGDWRHIPLAFDHAAAPVEDRPAPTPEHVYTITVFSGDPDKFRCREWGYYFRQSDAEAVIEQNQTDISELDYYHFAVLASKTEGPLAIPAWIQWYEFKWDGDKLLSVEKVSRPELYAHFGAPEKE